MPPNPPKPPSPPNPPKPPKPPKPPSPPKPPKPPSPPAPPKLTVFGMKPELSKIFTKAVALRKIKVDVDAFKHLKEYDLKWQPRFKKKWNTPLIQTILLDTAIKVALRKRRRVVNAADAQDAILSWHEGGQIDECYHTGLNIIKQSQKKPIKFALGASMQEFVEKNLV